MHTLYFVLDSLFNLYLMLVLMRIWLQWARADFYNPLSQFVVRFTQPLLGPLRRLIPSLGGLDLAALLLAYAVALLKFGSLMGLGLVQGEWSGLLLISLLLLLKQAGSLLFWILVVRAILSWVSQGRSPIEYVLHQLTEPLLGPIRRILPPLGGLDWSVLVLFILLQLVNFLLLDLVGPLWSML